MVYGWRGHRQQLSRLTAHPDELLVATAGRGNVAGQELHVIRCWNLACASAGRSPLQAASCWLEHWNLLRCQLVALLTLVSIKVFRNVLGLQRVIKHETVDLCNTASRLSLAAIACVAPCLCFVPQVYCALSKYNCIIMFEFFCVWRFVSLHSEV